MDRNVYSLLNQYENRPKNQDPTNQDPENQDIEQNSEHSLKESDIASNSTLASFLSGNPPEDRDALEQITVGLEPLTEFWQTRYLDEYIALGGGRIQCLTGRPGSGKTHLLRYFWGKAPGFKKVYFSARKIWLHDFKEIFFEILRQCDIMGCLRACADEIVHRMGFEPQDIPESMNFMTWLSEINQNTPMNKLELRNLLNEMFLKNPLLDNNFALAVARLTGGLLGHPTLEDPSKEALLSWMYGDRELKLSAIRRLGLSPMRITKYNARHMLRSLSEIIHMAGNKGLLVAIDDLEILISDNSLEPLRYTKAKRTDAYESIRELLDEIDTLPHMWFFFAFDRKLIDNEDLGLKSYYALWMRLQNEVTGERPNLFANMLDLDKLALFDAKTMLLLADRVRNLLHKYGYPAKVLTSERAEEILAHSAYGGIALPRSVVYEVCGKEATL